MISNIEKYMNRACAIFGQTKPLEWSKPLGWTKPLGLQSNSILNNHKVIKNLENGGTGHIQLVIDEYNKKYIIKKS
jgi:hypothetical protein